MSEVSGLAKRIRECGAVEQFDFGNLQTQTIDSIIRDAFNEAIPTKIPLRFALVVGAGRGQGKARYSDTLPKIVSAALREIGYEDSRGADTCWECQAMYKYQHDTDKNLKVIHVFPRMQRIEEKKPDSGPGSPSKEQSRLFLAAVCDIEKFNELISEKVWSFSQKSNLLDGLKKVVKTIKSAEEKLMSRQDPSELENRYYEAVASDVVSEKVKYVEMQLEELIDKEMLTGAEQQKVAKKFKKAVKKQTKKLENLKDEKKIRKLKRNVELLTERLQKTQKAQPVIWGGRNQKELEDLVDKLEEIEIIEQKNNRSNRMLKKLKQKGRLEMRLADIQQQEKGWFETQDELEL